MKPKTMVMLLVAVGCGVLAAVGSTLFAPRAAETVKIIVAKQDIPAMTRDGKTPSEQFAFKEVTKSGLSPNSITDMKQIENKVVTRRVAKDAPLTSLDLGDMFGFDLKEDERAVGINVNLEKTGGGFVMPGAHVDVISVKKAGQRSVVQTPFRDLEVLAVNQLTEQPQKVQGISPSTVTLKVTAMDAQKLTYFNQTTILSLALRSNKCKDADKMDPYLEAEDEEEVEFLVAKQDIEPNTVLEEPELLFDKKKVVKTKVPQGALHDFNVVRGKTVNDFILAGKEITPKHFPVKKAEVEVKPAKPRIEVAPPKVFVMVVSNGSNSEEKRFADRARTNDPKQVPPPPQPLNNEGSDGKP